ncbi:NAD(P)H-hydrate dehydratase [Thermincola ferriacetica]
MFLVTAEEMQNLDKLTIDQVGIPGVVLMENAGLQVVKVIKEILGEVPGKQVAVFAGKGNNGGDGFVIARHLLNMGAEVKVLLNGEPADITGDAKVNLNILQNMGQKIFTINNSNSLNIVKLTLVYTDLIVDAVFGTGFKGAVNDHMGKIISLINESGKPVVAVDIPSGLEANTGQVHGPCIRATHTVTFGLPKLGLTIHPGKEYAGQLHIADISIPPDLVKKQNFNKFLLTKELVAQMLPKRHSQGHKGDYGRVLVVAGSEGLTGAAVLTSTAVLKSGAGLATLAVPRSLHDLMEIKLTEVMTKPLPETEKKTISRDALDEVIALTESADVVALGPGISTEPATAGFVRDLLPELNKPVVIDADGLNALAGNLEVLKKIEAPVVITPHPGEMARLAGIKTEEVQNNRIEVAREFAANWRVNVVLKGTETVIAGVDGSLFVNSTGNPGMATGGSGDVLTGVIAGLIGQGLAPVRAAAAGVFIHGYAGDLGALEKGQAGLLAGDILNLLPKVFRELEGA